MSKQYAVFTAYNHLSPSAAASTNYLYYIANPVVSTTSLQAVQQGSPAIAYSLTSMWLMEESINGEYLTLDGRKWTKVYEYKF